MKQHPGEGAEKCHPDPPEPERGKENNNRGEIRTPRLGRDTQRCALICLRGEQRDETLIRNEVREKLHLTETEQADCFTAWEEMKKAEIGSIKSQVVKLQLHYPTFWNKPDEADHF